MGGVLDALVWSFVALLITCSMSLCHEKEQMFQGANSDAREILGSMPKPSQQGHLGQAQRILGRADFQLPWVSQASCREKTFSSLGSRPREASWCPVMPIKIYIQVQLFLWGFHVSINLVDWTFGKYAHSSGVVRILYF